ncbi:MAG TPA: tetratricopeptide repeat protein, partial [Chloroflexota bacterium]
SAMTAASHLAMVQGAFAQAGSFSSSAVELARQAGAEVVLGDALMTQGLVLLRQDDVQTAKQPFEESLALARVSGRRQRVAIVTRALGAIAQREGNVARGMELIEESVAIHQELHDLWELSTDYLSLGLLANQRGEQAQAKRYFRDSLRLAQRMGETDKIAYLLDVLGCLAVSGEDYKRAAHLFVAADALWGTVEVKSFRRTVEVAFPDNDREMRTRCEVAAREVLGGEWSVVQRAVAAMSLDEVAAYALAESG